MVVGNFEIGKFEDCVEWLENLEVAESPIWAGLPHQAEKVFKRLQMAQFISHFAKI